MTALVHLCDAKRNTKVSNVDKCARGFHQKILCQGYLKNSFTTKKNSNQFYVVNFFWCWCVLIIMHPIISVCCCCTWRRWSEFLYLWENCHISSDLRVVHHCKFFFFMMMTWLNNTERKRRFLWMQQNKVFEAKLCTKVWMCA